MADALLTAGPGTGPEALLHSRPTPYLLVDADLLRGNVDGDGRARARPRAGAAAAREDPQERRRGPAAARGRCRRADGGDGLGGRGVRRRRLPGRVRGVPAVGRRRPGRPAARAVRARHRRRGRRLRRGGPGARRAGAPAPRCSSRWTAGSTAPACTPSRPGRSRRAAARAGLDVRGVFTFPGHGYAPGGPGRRGGGGVGRAAGRGRVAGRARHRRPRRQRRLDADGRSGRRRRAHRAASGRLRLRRRAAVGARHHDFRPGRADLPGHRGQPRRRHRGPRRRQQGARRGPGRVGHRLGSAAGPPGSPGHTAVRAPRGGGVGRLLRSPAGQPAASGAQPRVHHGQPRRRAGAHHR